ncbi:MAG: adenosylcobalamin-dependent ribonucleoside-diphosphate reductase [Dehalococcoidia bacterium]|nr:adenosylcobalamin-dependent ribonucleoside-diphosphate reductase [Dehalococcoidia bacterium]
MVLDTASTNVTSAPADLKPVALTDNSRVVLERRYLRKGEGGRIIETPEEMFWRVAYAIAEPETDRDAASRSFYNLMADMEFMPNSPTLMNAGTGQGTFSACFVLPVEDSMDSIMDTAKATAMVQKYGGGTGFAFSRLRQKGAPIATTHGKACGPVSVLQHYDDVSRMVTQGGKRDGANMGILSIHHPDIREFIHCKDDGESITRFNISVAISDVFMEAYEQDGEYDLVDPRTKEVVGTLRAREILEEIVESAWKTGDPGLVFIDTINRDNPTPHKGYLWSTNPCGEVPLLDWEACNLGSLNVARFWDEGRQEMDWNRMREAVRLATRFLDNVVTTNNFPLPQIRETVDGNRKIGLGVMGWADLLIMRGIPYNSEEAIEFGESLMGFISRESDEMSMELGEERGVFPWFEGSVYDKPGARPMRNATRTCIAPTGTISIIAGASSGIEPLFSLAHYRTMGDGTVLPEIADAFQDLARKRDFWSADLMAELAGGASIHGRSDIPDDVQRLFPTAMDISETWHIRMQAAFQKGTDLAVSKTINLKNEATVDDIRSAYTLAYKTGCKGITIYRDGSRDWQVLSHKKEEATPAAPTPQRRRLPDERPSITHKFRVGEQEGYLTVGLYDDGSPGEIFVNIAREGSTVSGLVDAVALLTSVSIQYGVPLADIVRKLKNTRFEPSGMTGNPDIPQATSILDYIYRWLDRKFELGVNGHGHEKLPVVMAEVGPAGLAQLEAQVADNDSGLGCPDCGALLVYQEGCLLCRACGYNKCG